MKWTQLQVSARSTVTVAAFSLLIVLDKERELCSG